MELPCQTDYVRTYFTLFDRFQQTACSLPQRGRPYTYSEQLLIVFFTHMLMRRITTFKAQERWIASHPTGARDLGFSGRPHRKKRWVNSRRTLSLIPPVGRDLRDANPVRAEPASGSGVRRSSSQGQSISDLTAPHSQFCHYCHVVDGLVFTGI